MKNKKSLVTLSQQGSFEAYDFDENEYFIREKTVAMTYNSEINRNTFIHLKYYNYSNYILNAYT